MAKWIREEVSGVLKLAVYVNLDKEPEIAKWMNRPSPKGDGIR